MNVENTTLVPSFVVFQAEQRRVAFPRENVRELIASPSLFWFPHTTPGIAGVVLRRGRILPVLNLEPGVAGTPAAEARFFLVVERKISGSLERCAIPIQGECELVNGTMIPAEGEGGIAIGHLDLNGEQIEVLDLEKAIAAGSADQEVANPVAEALP
jgi:chemotaxis signal transduction protein